MIPATVQKYLNVYLQVNTVYATRPENLSAHLITPEQNQWELSIINCISKQVFKCSNTREKIRSERAVCFLQAARR